MPSTGIIQGYGYHRPIRAGDGGQFSNASYYMPTGAVFVLRSLGNSVFSDLYISDLSSNVVRKVDGATGIITTIAGTGLSGPLGDGGPATSATLSFPWSLAYFNGSLYIADSGNDRVRAVNLTGIITTVAGNRFTLVFLRAMEGPVYFGCSLSPRQITCSTRSARCTSPIPGGFARSIFQAPSRPTRETETPASGRITFLPRNQTVTGLRGRLLNAPYQPTDH